VRPRQRDLNVLGRFLDQAMAKKGLTDKSFRELLSIRRSTLSNLKHRKPTAAPEQSEVDRWAAALGLTRVEAQQLFLVSQLAFAPVPVQELVEQLRGEVERLRPRGDRKR
jgi:transcriptional regulator with XRE-family HTH domain